MKTNNGFLTVLLLAFLTLSTSCRQEESISIGNPPEDRLVAGSNAAELLVQIATKDGSIDNILDGASCISLKLPVTVVLDGSEITVDGAEDLDLIEDLLDEELLDDVLDIDLGIDDENNGQNTELEIVFPVTVLSADYSETTVTDAVELQNLADQCQTGSDDDIECIDIEYPITISLFDTLREIFDTISVEDDQMLYDFMVGLGSSTVANIDFPVSLVLSDATKIEVADVDGLTNIIQSSITDCDEDDDNDFWDDNCDDCSIDRLLELWANCPTWEVQRLKINRENVKENYEALSFNFLQDGAVQATSDSDSFSGTWSASGSANSITMVIAIPGLDDFNATWNLKEIKQNSEKTEVQLYLNENELYFRSTCSEED